jgi:hypothetical protein
LYTALAVTVAGDSAVSSPPGPALNCEIALPV